MGAPFRPSNPPAPRGGTRSYKNDDTGTMAAKGIGRRSYRERNLAENGNYLSGRTIIITITNNNNNKKGRVCILYHDSLTTRRDGRTERRIPPITGRPGRESGRTPPPTNFTSPPRRMRGRGPTEKHAIPRIATRKGTEDLGYGKEPHARALSRIRCAMGKTHTLQRLRTGTCSHPQLGTTHTHRSVRR